MEQKKREILAQASKIYMKCGVKSVTMDEMARQLGVSKKTLYLHVTDKNDLVEQCMGLIYEEKQVRIKEIASQTENAIEQMLRMSQFVISDLQQVQPSVFFDLAKYHPSAMKMMEIYKVEFICSSIEQNIVDGINQGLYRKTLNPKVISAIYVRLIDILMGGEVMVQARLNTDEVYSEMFRYHIRGCASEQGLEYLVELIKNEDSLSAGL